MTLEYLVVSESKQVFKKQRGTCFSSTYTKIGTIQRFSRPLYKDDMQIGKAFHISVNFMYVLSEFFKKRMSSHERNTGTN